MGLTSTNALVTFDRATPGNASQPVSITGLLFTNEQILGIDRRPATGQLVDLGSSGNLYALHSGSGAASFVSVLSGAALTGNSFGVDLNPVVDRLRLTSNSGQNLRVNVDTGAATVDGALNGASSWIAAAAYFNNFASATSTTLYGIDTVQDALLIQAPPNNGTQTLVGALSVNSGGMAGFDHQRSERIDLCGPEQQRHRQELFLQHPPEHRRGHRSRRLRLRRQHGGSGAAAGHCRLGRFGAGHLGAVRRRACRVGPARAAAAKNPLIQRNCNAGRAGKAGRL